jgi:hypothetical protein
MIEQALTTHLAKLPHDLITSPCATDLRHMARRTLGLSTTLATTMSRAS